MKCRTVKWQFLTIIIITIIIITIMIIIIINSIIIVIILIIIIIILILLIMYIRMLILTISRCRLEFLTSHVVVSTRCQARNEYDKTIQETEAMGEKQRSGRKPPGPSKLHAFGPISGDRFRG